jgi:hypothetical protein
MFLRSDKFPKRLVFCVCEMANAEAATASFQQRMMSAGVVSSARLAQIGATFTPSRESEGD